MHCSLASREAKPPARFRAVQWQHPHEYLHCEPNGAESYHEEERTFRELEKK